MSKLNTLRDKNPKEVAVLLSAVTNSLLPDPGTDEGRVQIDADPELVREVLSEIRTLLRVNRDDHSPEVWSRVYAFLSDEISNAALGHTNLNKLKSRLGDKGELHPSQYEVKFGENFEWFEEAFGTRRAHIAEAVTQPNDVAHLKVKYLSEESDPHITLSVKVVSTRRVEDKFFLFVISAREGATHQVSAAFRVYPSDVDMSEAADPVGLVRVFTETYGQHFRLGGTVTKFLHNDVVTFDEQTRPRSLQMQPVGLPAGSSYLPILAGGSSTLRGTEAKEMGEVVIAFVVNVRTYAATLRKHGVNILPESSWRFPRVGELP